ncbi:Transcription factor 25, variant 3 [Schistosoma haematobium]|uniref:Transcription factor 25, variant 3 n=1 Tax=Schistosoma haematobium TaxID=6185 RepID=A0A922LQB6_SCHHA|nr:Transcription factor 25, variant 3 [Schistosoma haematobium]KAH9591191.1 Transcription factor 25, variant 3 [Schistosoma haematobium]
MSSRVLRKLKKDSENSLDDNNNFSDNDDPITGGSVFSEFSNCFPSQLITIPSSDDNPQDHCESFKSKKRRKKKNKQKDKTGITYQLGNIKLPNDPGIADQNKQIMLENLVVCLGQKLSVGPKHIYEENEVASNVVCLYR